MINLMAVVEFLENVDLGAVGVGEGVGIVRWVFQLAHVNVKSLPS